MSFEVKQIVTQIIAFLIMLWILRKYAWKPILGIMHERTQRIQATFDEADKKNMEADRRLAEYERKIQNIEDEGKLIIQNSIKEAQQAAQDLNIETQAKASEMIKKAQDEIAQEHVKARKMFENEAVDLTFMAFEKLAKIKLSKDERDKLGLQLIDEGL
jgi:F-type H+-transporting ATPase subunit b